MSIEAMCWAENVRAPSANAKFVLLVMCMSSGMIGEDRGQIDWGIEDEPSLIERLCARTQLSFVKVDQALTGLRRSGLISRCVCSQGKPVFRFNIEPQSAGGRS